MLDEKKSLQKKKMADNPTEDRRNREKTSTEEKSSGNMNAEQGEGHGADSPTESLKTISDDEEIDYSVKPEFYDAHLDDKDESWAQKQRRGRTSDAVLSCPACFTSLCFECQRHEKYLTQYRAIFVRNCKIKKHEIVHSDNNTHKRKRGKGSSSLVGEANGEAVRPVCCLVCSTEVGVIDEDEVYHFFNVIPSEP
ncbi:E2F-associated phosphoprotein [Impatiens glandulifera]|uniref:E2F-associated phosphoprotein n=1 Tax=Impatiens glandulifera TaxID=253017 RepID=UPI001FB0F42F|nr:E2F-associated phosphoprotein [Impatiens glandulifera]